MKVTRVVLSDAAQDGVDKAAARHGHSSTEALRIALGLYVLLANCIADGNLLIITTPDGTALKEVVFPLALKGGE